MKLSGKVAIVTGGGSGIGKSIVLQLADDGADVAVVDIDESAASHTASMVESRGRKSISVCTDVCEKQQIEEMVESTKKLGNIDILVNNAGVEKITPLPDIAVSEWNQIIEVNLTGTFLVSQSVAAAMIIADRGGKIVNIGSIAGLMAIKNEPHYVASKAGVHMLTKQLALELAPHKINVNAVAPGIIRNGLSSTQSLSTSEKARELEARIPWQRAGTPKEIANAVSFLASDEARYVTGVILAVDGGVTIAGLQ